MGCDSQFDTQATLKVHRYIKYNNDRDECSCGETFASFDEWATHAGKTMAKGPIDLTEAGTKGMIKSKRYERFHSLLRELESLHDSKGADYDGTGPEYNNHKAVQDWGIAAWKSPLLRIGEKMKRLQNFAQSGNINYDGVEDSLKDIAVLSLIALILFQEEQ